MRAQLKTHRRMWWLFAFRMFADYCKSVGAATCVAERVRGKVRLAGTADTLKGGTD
jgi:hypothetical protein